MTQKPYFSDQAIAVYAILNQDISLLTQTSIIYSIQNVSNVFIKKSSVLSVILNQVIHQQALNPYQ